MPSSIYKYYPTREGRLHCAVCDYSYVLDAPLSTLQKHLRVKHGFSVRKPPINPPVNQVLEKRELAVHFHPLMREARPAEMEARLTATEESIVKWAYQERIPYASLESSNFQQMFSSTPEPPRMLKILQALEKLNGVSPLSSFSAAHSCALPPISLLFAQCKDLDDFPRSNYSM